MPDLVSRIARLELPRHPHPEAAREQLVAAIQAQLQHWADPALPGEPAHHHATDRPAESAMAQAIARLSVLAVSQAREMAQLRARWNEQRDVTSAWPTASGGRAHGHHRLDEADGSLRQGRDELIRQVQQALDLSMDRLDVACERFRAVSDAHELRMENLRKSIDAERSDRDRSLAGVHTGSAQLALHIEAEARSLRAVDQQLGARLQGVIEGQDKDHARLDRLRERIHQQREALKAGEARLTELAQAVQADHARLQQRLRWLSGGLVLTAALVATALALAWQGLAG